MRRRSPAVYFVLMAIAAVGFIIVDRLAPRQHLPWRTIDIEAPTGTATSAQLLRLSLSSSKTCMDLADNALDFSSVQTDPKTDKGKCGWTVARDVLGTSNGVLASETVMQCPLAVGTYIWIREIDGLARKHFGVPLNRIHHYGSYSCRKQNGNESGRWSEHAFANAWDIASFELETGESISVLKHWNEGTPKQKQFLRDVRKEACKIFRVTLSPDYNAAHKNHFHVDMGPSSTCS